MILNYTSSKEVIAKVFSDLDLQEESHRVADMKEWVTEALEKIGAVTQLKRKISGVESEPIIVVTNHQATLPTDLHRLEQVAFSFTKDGVYFPMRYFSGTMDVRSIDSKTLEYSATKHYVKGDIVTYQDNTYICLLEHNTTGTVPKTPNTEAGLAYWMLYVPVSQLIIKDYIIPDLQYTLKPGYIVTNIDQGYLKLSYDAYNLDTDGYPLVPDMASYKEAIFFYITKKLKYPEYLSGRINPNIYRDICSSWNFYRNQAYAEALMPGNADQMESIKNTWNKLYPELDAHDTFYSTVTQPQKLYNKPYGRVY